VRYKTVVTEVGPLVADFVREGRLVLFAEGAPEELHSFSVLHRPEDVFEEVRPGDVVHMGGIRRRVTAVGDVANANLKALGHAAFKCNGKEQPELPGDICLEAAELPMPEVGQNISIEVEG